MFTNVHVPQNLSITLLLESKAIFAPAKQWCQIDKTSINSESIWMIRAISKAVITNCVIKRLKCTWYVMCSKLLRYLWVHKNCKRAINVNTKSSKLHNKTYGNKAYECNTRLILLSPAPHLPKSIPVTNLKSSPTPFCVSTQKKWISAEIHG